MVALSGKVTCPYSADSIEHTVFLIEIFWKIENSTLDRDSTQNLSAKRYSNVLIYK